jgi:hypothetical protein
MTTKERRIEILKKLKRRMETEQPHPLPLPAEDLIRKDRER